VYTQGWIERVESMTIVIYGTIIFYFSFRGLYWKRFGKEILRLGNSTMKTTLLRLGKIMFVTIYDY
jgi:hypothetical protein